MKKDIQPKTVNETKHTPGPWEVAIGSEADERGNMAAVYSGTVGTIASLTDEMTDWKSNARLIAAAPELFKAVELLLKAYGSSDARNGNSGECWDKARSSYAKARGEKS